MASFTNFATLIYNGGTSNSNTVTGELLETLTLTKTAASSRYTARDNVTYVLSLVNGGTAPLTELALTDNLGGYAFGTDTVYPLTYNEGTLRVYVNGVLQTTPTVTAGPPLTVTGLTVPAGGNALLVYEAAVTRYAPLDQEAAITNTATVTGGGLAAPLTAQATLAAAQRADLTVSKAICPFRALALCLDGNLHGITVHGVSRLILGYKDILVPPFHGHKTKSPRMAAEYSGYGADIRLAVLSFFRDTDLSLRQQCIQHFLQFFSLPLRHIQKNRHLLQLHRNVGRFFHQLQYHALSLCQLFLCHNFLVFCFFAAFYSALSLCPKDAGKNPVRRAFPIHYRSTFP